MSRSQSARCNTLLRRCISDYVSCIRCQEFDLITRYKGKRETTGLYLRPTLLEATGVPGEVGLHHKDSSLFDSSRLSKCHMW